MRKILKNNRKTAKKLKKLPKIYLVACWANYGVMEHYFSGKYVKNEKGLEIPLVYDYNYFNGVKDLYVLRKITNTTTGNIIMWTMSKSVACRIKDALNAQHESFWETSEKGCVIKCANCNERLEMCYPDGTEIRELPYCPFCGSKMFSSECEQCEIPIE